MLKQELREELTTLLPDQHPFLAKFDEHCPDDESMIEEVDVDILDENGTSSQETLAPFTRLVDTIHDWKRGIRDWAEVEVMLMDAEKELNLV